MDTFGWQKPKFGPFGKGFAHVHLGQTSVSSLEARADAAVAKYADLLGRYRMLKDSGEAALISEWIGASSIPGSPADRFVTLQEEIRGNGPWDEIRTGHLEALEAANAELETRVLNGEKAGVMGPMAIVDNQGKLTGTGVSLVAVAVLCLVVIPLSLK